MHITIDAYDIFLNVNPQSQISQTRNQQNQLQRLRVKVNTSFNRYIFAVWLAPI